MWQTQRISAREQWQGWPSRAAWLDATGTIGGRLATMSSFYYSVRALVTCAISVRCRVTREGREMDSCRSQRWIPRSIGGSCPPPRLEFLEYLLDYLHEFIELLQFRGAECAKPTGEDFHAAPAAFEQNARAFVCCRNLRAALVLPGAPPH